MEYNSLSMLYGGDPENFKRISSTASLNALRLMKLMNSGLTTNRRKATKERLIEGMKRNNDSININHHHLHDLNFIPLEKQLMLYEQSKKYAPNKSFEPIAHVPMVKFIRPNISTKNDYSPCLIYSKSNLLHKHVVVCKNQFTSKTPQDLSLNKTKLSQSMAALSSKKLPSFQIDKIDHITNQAEEQLEEFKKEILRNESIKTFKTNKISQSKSQVNIKQIREDFNFSPNQSYRINQNEIINNNYNKVKLCLDKKSRGFLIGVLNQIKYEDNKLNKPEIFDFTIETLYFKNKLKKEFSLVRNETMQMKKEFKGEQSIEHPNDINKIKKLIKGMICRNIKGEDFHDDLITRKNVFRFKNFNFPERRFIARQKKKKKHVP